MIEVSVEGLASLLQSASVATSNRFQDVERSTKVASRKLVPSWSVLHPHPDIDWRTKSLFLIEEKSDSLEDIVHDTIEKGKDFIEDIKNKDEAVEEIKEEPKEKLKEDSSKADDKSARDRLKDKGLL